MNNVSVVPILFIAMDFVWFLSPFIVLLLFLMVIKSLYKLPKYPDDRRRHFYPLQAYILVFSGLLILCNLVILVSGHISPVPLFNVPAIYIHLFSLFSFFIVIGEVVFQRRLPLTKNQERYRRLIGR